MRAPGLRFCPDPPSIRWDAGFGQGYAGIPFVINSGARCREHNQVVGGSETSSHLTGYAADIRCRNGQERLAIVRGLIKAGIWRIGIARGFVHADIDPDKMQSMWVY